MCDYNWDDGHEGNRDWSPKNPVGEQGTHGVVHFQFAHQSSEGGWGLLTVTLISLSPAAVSSVGVLSPHRVGREGRHGVIELGACKSPDTFLLPT